MSETETVEAWCVKCKEKRTMLNPEHVTVSNGRKATKGACGVCGTKLYRMGN